MARGWPRAIRIFREVTDTPRTYQPRTRVVDADAGRSDLAADLNPVQAAAATHGDHVTRESGLFDE